MAAADIDLTRLRVEELRQLSERVAREIARRSMRRRYGGGFVERREAVYRNPENPVQTWSGRGDRPDWIRRALAAGRTLDNLRV